MATTPTPIRLSPGVYRVGGRIVKGAKDAKDALRLAGVKSTPSNPKVALPTKQPSKSTPERIINRGLEVGTRAIDNANTQAKDPNYQLGQAFAPKTIDRITQGGIEDYRNKVEQDVYARLTRGNKEDFAMDYDAKKQELYNRGIPLDENAQQYKRHMDALNKRYREADLAAKQQAGIDSLAQANTLVGMNENVIQNQISQGQAIRGQQLGEQAGLQNIAAGSLGMKQDQNAATAALEELKRQGKLTAAQIAQMNASTNLTNAQTESVQAGNNGSSSPFVA